MVEMGAPEGNSNFANADIIYYGKTETPEKTEEGYVPVMLAADENYSRQMYITLLSILKNKQPETKYVVYLFVPELFSEHLVKLFGKLAEEYDSKAKFVVMGDIFSNIEMSIGHITSPTYYRILAPGIIPYDKCVYLDVDLIALCDLNEIYGIDIEDNYLMGVKAPSYICSPGHGRKYCKKTGIASIDQYVNAGVLVMNLKLFREEGLVEKAMKLVPQKYPSQDQGILNSLAYNRIKHLDCCYNVMTKYNLSDESRVFQITETYGLSEAFKGYAAPKIIHYADKRKPWNSISSPYADTWWKYCAMTEFYEEMWNEFIEKSKGEVRPAGLKNKLYLMGKKKNN